MGQVNVCSCITFSHDVGTFQGQNIGTWLQVGGLRCSAGVSLVLVGLAFAFNHFRRSACVAPHSALQTHCALLEKRCLGSSPPVVLGLSGGFRSLQCWLGPCPKGVSQLTMHFPPPKTHHTSTATNHHQQTNNQSTMAGMGERINEAIDTAKEKVQVYFRLGEGRRGA